MAFNELYGLGFESHLHYDERLSAVTADAVRALANRLLVPNSRVLSIVGPQSTQGPEANFVPEGIEP